MYGEEADLCLRAHAFGARPMITPDATIVHYGGASERARTDKMVRLLAAKASLITRHWPAHIAPLGRALNAAWPLSRAIATNAAATIMGRPHLQDAAHTWRNLGAVTNGSTVTQRRDDSSKPNLRTFGVIGPYQTYRLAIDYAAAARCAPTLVQRPLSRCTPSYADHNPEQYDAMCASFRAGLTTRAANSSSTTPDATRPTPIRP
jgi:hypothetical protein